MTPAQRERFVESVLDALSDPQKVMAEGQRHKKAKGRAMDMLTLHFGATGRVIYLAEEIAVLYPGEATFAPDILAVLDVPQIDDDPRMAWVVADEGRGLSMVLEVLHHGDRNKHLVANVERYARLRIPEYFVYDRLRQQVLGYRLPSPTATHYQRIVPQLGRHPSAVLGLDLAIGGGKLQFFHGMAELFGSAELIDRLQGMMGDLEARAEQAETQAAQLQTQKEQAQAREEQALAREEQALAQAAQLQTQKEQAQAQSEQAMTGLRETIVALLGARGISCPEDARARLLSCQDPALLQRWLLRAAIAASAGDIFNA